MVSAVPPNAAACSGVPPLSVRASRSAPCGCQCRYGVGIPDNRRHMQGGRAADGPRFQFRSRRQQRFDGFGVPGRHRRMHRGEAPFGPRFQFSLPPPPAPLWLQRSRQPPPHAGGSCHRRFAFPNPLPLAGTESRQKPRRFRRKILYSSSRNRLAHVPGPQAPRRLWPRQDGLSVS